MRNTLLEHNKTCLCFSYWDFYKHHLCKCNYGDNIKNAIITVLPIIIIYCCTGIVWYREHSVLF